MIHKIVQLPNEAFKVRSDFQVLTCSNVHRIVICDLFLTAFTLTVYVIVFSAEQHTQVNLQLYLKTAQFIWIDEMRVAHWSWRVSCSYICFLSRLASYHCYVCMTVTPESFRNHELYNNKQHLILFTMLSSLPRTLMFDSCFFLALCFHS